MSQQRELGTRIDSRYRLESILGSGASGTVYLATDEDLARQVAIKLLNLNSSLHSDVKGRFEREAKALSQLLHPNIVRVFRFGVLDDSSPFLVMEYLGGKSLRSLIEEKKQLSCAEAVAIAQQLAAALEYAHSANIVHRDLKPENVILADESSGSIAKIIDFGLCKQTDALPAAALTQTGYLIGTAMYMSPEQCMGKDVDWRTDIYSFACVLFELITGEPPFTGDSHASILLKQLSDPLPAILDLSPNCGLPAELQDLILSCGNKKKEERCQSFSEIRKLLGEIEALNCTKKFVRAKGSHGQVLKTASKIFRPSRKLAFTSLSLIVLGLLGLSTFLFGSEQGNDVLTSQLQTSLSVDDSIKGLSVAVKQLVDSGQNDNAMKMVRQSSGSRKFASWAALDRERLLQNYIQIFADAKQPEKVFLLKVKLLQELMDSVQPKIMESDKKKRRDEPDPEREELVRLAEEFLKAPHSDLEWTQISQALETSWKLQPRYGDPLVLWVLRAEARRSRANISEDDSKSLVKIFYVATQHCRGQRNFEYLKKMVDEGVALAMKYGVYNRATLMHTELGNYYLEQGQLELARAQLALAQKCAKDTDLSGGEVGILADFTEGCRIGKVYRHKRKPMPPKGMSRIERYALTGEIEHSEN